MNESLAEVVSLWTALDKNFTVTAAVIDPTPETEMRSLMETVFEGYTLSGMRTFTAIKATIDSSIAAMNADALEALFEHGPWNPQSPVYYPTRKIIARLQSVNEYSNTVGYLFHKALDQLRKSGKHDIALRILANPSMKGMAYHPYGGNIGEPVFIA
ncbi:hypothetical protein C4573_05275 [Candidatus Woesearchaeota archaeon]|nr:MAG: hypothetical protein C4573_05275 [Candidatus Woesearchaeota archaeon]